MHEFHRQSIRLKDHDYSTPGGYFVTIVAFQRECLFGGIVNGEMQVNDLGRIVREEWFRTAKLRPYVELLEDEFVVMPNHIHGIIRIFEDDVVPIVVGAPSVGAQRRCAPTIPSARHLKNVQPRSLGQSSGHLNPRSHIVPDANYTPPPSGSEIITNISSGTKPNTNASPDTSSPIHPTGTMTRKTSTRGKINPEVPP